MTVDKPTSLTVTCTQTNIAQGLGMVGRVATTRSSLPILANIHLWSEEGQLKLAATDLEIGVTTGIGAKVESQGSITLPARLFVDFVTANTDDTITIAVNGTQAQLTSAHYQATIAGMDASEFPFIPAPGKEESATLSASELKECLADVTFAAAVDDSRPVLNGVRVEVTKGELVVAATDSYRLAERKVKLTKKGGGTAVVILPSRAASEIIRLLPDNSDVMVRLSLAKSQLSLEFGDTHVVSRLVEGTYPDYTQVIPTTATTTVTASRLDCLAAVKMANLFARDAAHHIRLWVQPESKDSFQIKTTASSAGTNQGTIAAEVDGESIQIAFNAKFLQDALLATRGQTVRLTFLSPDRPVVIRGEGDDQYVNLVMPLRLDA